MSRNPNLTAELLSALNLGAVVPQSTLQRGIQYYAQGRVRVLECHGANAILEVRGSLATPYRVTCEAVVGGGTHFVSFDCNCPVFHPEAPCKHIVASIHALRDHLKRNPQMNWETAINTALRQTTEKKAKTGRASAKAVLFFSLQKRTQRWSIYPVSLPASKFPAEALEPVLDREVIFKTLKLEALADRTTAVRNFEPGRYIAMTPQTLLAARMATMMQSYGYVYGYYSYQGASGLEQVLPLLGDALVFVGNEQNPLRQPITLHTDPLVAALRMKEDTEGLRLIPSLQKGEAFVPLDSKQVTILAEDPLWLLLGKDIYCLEGAPSAFLALASRDPIIVPAGERSLFFERYLIPLAEQMIVSGDGVAMEEMTSLPTKPRLYLSEDAQGGKAGSLRAHLRFGYGDEEFPYSADLPASSLYYEVKSQSLRRIVRNPDAERRAWEGLSEFSLKRDVETGWFTLRARVDPLDFLIRQIPRLAAAGYEVFGEENLFSLRVNRNKPTMRLSVSSGIDWFDLEAVVQFGEVEASLKDIRRAIRHKEKYIKLADGSIGMIPEEWIERYRFLFGLGEEQSGAKMRYARQHALLLEEALSLADARDADAEFQQRKERLKAFSEIAPRPLPEGVYATLYPYQKAGYDWLHFLHEYDFGGCLADDMGLGKTLMTIVYLLSLRRAEGKDFGLPPDLVVVPRSLVFNWEREVQKFAPGLRLLRWEGLDRVKDTEAFKDYDLIVTTYRIMLNEIETLRKFRFHYAILDEAQAIKNPMSQTARAARLLNADHRLTLTGTPVENAAYELWSQFEFLCPGLLGNLEQFREQFGSAIEKEQSVDAAKSLRRLVQPFLLRRTKDQVAPELPPRTEEVQIVDMEPAQRKAYNKLRDQYRGDILNMLEGAAPGGRAQMKILEALLRLRQICCHPRLADQSFKGDSGKFQAILETMETLQAEGHKALIFSQFVQMLTIVREELDARKIPYVYLDGSTRDREARVDTFQNDPNIPFFLISLKAGGFGLNLTAADYVLHIDPWWNPAVEQQATDRAHRIGQDKPVFVYKFIARDSVEEKVLELQERKRSLANQLVATEEGMLKALTRADIEALFT